MTDVEKIDLLCSEHMNGLTTVWAVTKCLEDIYNFLNICSMEDIIIPRERNDLVKHYDAVASEKIAAILEDVESNDTMILAQQLDKEVLDEVPED